MKEVSKRTRVIMLNTNNKFKASAGSNKKLYELTDKDISDIQNYLLNVLDDIAAFCEENKLEYFLSGGTALGAIRHKGYIPWDEDLDIAMPRKSYDIFAQRFEQEYQEKYFVQEIRRSPNYDLNFMKVRAKGTVFEEVFDPEEDKAGVFVDIFPIENTYDSSIKRRIHGIISEGLLFICSCVRIHSKYERILKYYGDDENLVKILKIKNVIGMLFSFFSLHKWLMMTEKWLSRCKDEDTKDVTIPTGRGHYWGELYKREDIFPQRKVSYENRSYMTFQKVEEYLSILYGDYMKIPPVEKRERHSVVKYTLEK